MMATVVVEFMEGVHVSYPLSELPDLIPIEEVGELSPSEHSEVATDESRPEDAWVDVPLDEEPPGGENTPLIPSPPRGPDGDVVVGLPEDEVGRNVAREDYVFNECQVGYHLISRSLNARRHSLAGLVWRKLRKVVEACTPAIQSGAQKLRALPGLAKSVYQWAKSKRESEDTSRESSQLLGEVLAVSDSAEEAVKLTTEAIGDEELQFWWKLTSPPTTWKGTEQQWDIMMHSISTIFVPITATGVPVCWEAQQEHKERSCPGNCDVSKYLLRECLRTTRAKSGAPVQRPDINVSPGGGGNGPSPYTPPTGGVNGGGPLNPTPTDLPRARYWCTLRRQTTLLRDLVSYLRTHSCLRVRSVGLTAHLREKARQWCKENDVPLDVQATQIPKCVAAAELIWEEEREALRIQSGDAGQEAVEVFRDYERGIIRTRPTFWQKLWNMGWKLGLLDRKARPV
jgi:hypothetical protein